MNLQLVVDSKTYKRYIDQTHDGYTAAWYWWRGDGFKYDTDPHYSGYWYGEQIADCQTWDELISEMSAHMRGNR